MSTHRTLLQPRGWLPVLGCLLFLAIAPEASQPSAGAMPLPRTSASSVPGWTQLLNPFQREQHSAIYDPVRDRIVLFGGDDGGNWDNDVWVLPLSGPGQWTKLQTAGTPPSPRVMHSAIYDPVRDRMIVFGGDEAYFQQSTIFLDVSALNDVWTLSLSGTPTWSPLNPIGLPPSPRKMHSAIYDPVRDRMLVYGGHGGLSDFDSDVWALSLSGSPVWTQVVPVGPISPARYGHTALYDPLRDRMVVFGGMNEANLIDHESNDAWALSLSGTPSWSNLSPSGTPPDVRARAAAIYDPVRDRMIVTGGEFMTVANVGGTFVYSDTWALSLSGGPTWTQIALPSLGRTESAALYDPVRDRMIMVCGWNFGVRSDVFALDLPNPQAWSTVTSPQPADRFAASAFYDAGRQRMIMFGGIFRDWHTASELFGGHYRLGDTWTLSLTGPPTWARVATTGTLPEGGNAATYDPVRNRLLTFGGVAVPSNVYTNSVRELPLAGASTWTLLSPSGGPPSGRSGSSAMYDPVRDRILIFGGKTASNAWSNEVWELSLSGAPAWSPLTPSGTPPSGRTPFAGLYDPSGDRMVIFGGRDPGGLLNDVWALSLSEPPAWIQITPSGPPPGVRDECSAILDPYRSRLIVFGGLIGYSTDDGAWALPLAGAPTWTDLLGAGATRIARGGHSAIYDLTNDRMVVVSGYDDAGALKNDTWALEFGAPTPTLVSLAWARPFADRVELAWQVDASAVASAAVERCETGGAWRTLANVATDGLGRVSCIDREISPGSRYGYRLRVSTGCGTATSAETWVDVPAASEFALFGARPNPASDRMVASFTLPAAGPARLELLDVSGRRIAARDVGALGAGAHTVDLTPPGSLAPGVYLLRLVRDGRALTARAAVIR